MKIVDVNKSNEGYLINCSLHSASEKDYTNYNWIKKSFIDKYKEKGQGVKLMQSDDGTTVGRLHYVPIELSPLIGENLLVILCLYVHMYKHNIGDMRHKGYGKFFLDYVEKVALKKNYDGVAVWAMDWNWNPISFYIHNGYEITDREDRVIAAWKPFSDRAKPPKLARIPDSYFKSPKDGRVSMVLADNPWCDGMQRTAIALEAVKGLEDKVVTYIVNDHAPGGYIHLGNIGGVFLNGKPYHPYEHLENSEELRKEILSIWSGEK